MRPVFCKLQSLVSVSVCMTVSDSGCIPQFVNDVVTDWKPAKLNETRCNVISCMQKSNLQPYSGLPSSSVVTEGKPANTIVTSASVKLTQTRHSHSK